VSALPDGQPSAARLPSTAPVSTRVARLLVHHGALDATDDLLPLERLDESALLAVERARSLAEPCAARGPTDLHLLLGVLDAAPHLQHCLRPAIGIERVMACLHGALADTSCGPGASGFDDAGHVLRQAARTADGFAQFEVTPAHLLLAMLQRRPTALAWRLRALGLSIPTTVDALSAHLRGERPTPAGRSVSW
jgi:hypothetical protein